MEVAHRKFGNEWGQFDRYCKLVLCHEAIDYLRELQRKSDHEKPLDALSPEEWDKLSLGTPATALCFRRMGAAGISTMSLSPPPLPICPSRSKAF